VEISVPAFVLKADANGSAPSGSYLGSGTRISVREGSTALTFKGAFSGNSQFKIGTPVISTGSITVGARTGVDQLYAIVGDHSAMSDNTDSLVITYPITYRRANGSEETISVSQSISKAKGAVRTAIATLYKWSNSSPTPPSGTFSYTWSTGAYTLPTSNAAGWTVTPGSSTPGYTLYTITQYIIDEGSAITTTGISWTNTTVGTSGAAGANGSNGAAGSPGTRGSVTRYSTATANWNGITSTYVDTTTKNIVDLFPSSTVIAGDYVTIKGPSAVMTKYYNGSAWIDPGQFIDGNLFVNGTITADKIDSRGLSIKDANGNVLLQAGTSFIGGESLIDIDNQTLTGSWASPTIISLRANGSDSTGQPYQPGDILTLSADMAAGSELVSAGRVSHLAIYTTNSSGTWTASAYIEGASSTSIRKSISITLPVGPVGNLSRDIYNVEIRLSHSAPGGAVPSPAVYTGTAYASNIMLERGLVATTYKKAAISANNKITSAKTSTYIASLDAGVITTGSLSAKRIDSGDSNVGTGLTFALGTALALPKIGLGGAGDGSITAAGSFRSAATGAPFTLVGINEYSAEGYGLIAVRKNSTGAAIASWGNWNGLVSSSKTISSSAIINANAIGAIFSALNNSGGTGATNYITSKATLASGSTASTATGLELLNYDATGNVASTSKYGVGISSVWYALNSDAVIKTTNSTSSSSSTTGALIVTGGAGIGGNLNVGGNLAVTGTFTPASMSLSSTTNSTSQSTGALSVAGGVGIAKDVYIGPEVTSSIFTKMKTTLASGNASFESRSVDDQGLSYNLVKLGLYDSNLTGLYILGVDRAGNLGPGGASAGNTSTYYNSIQSGIWYALYNTTAGRVKLSGNSSGTTVVDVAGSITATGTITPFTGSHDGFINAVPEVGDIVTDKTCLLHKDVYNTVFEVEISSTPAQKSIVGIYANTYDVVPERFLEDGEFYIDPESIDGLSYIIFNSVGEGQINVCGENGNIEKGDLLVTSSIPGKGMRQSDDIVRAYTVAKARESVTFENSSEVKMIACIYMCG
jgi:hypothetical protein